MTSFYSRLSYSFGNEDWETEKKALQIQPRDRILCVTASGDRPLNLMTEEFGEIIAIDSNPIQNALFDLKRTALSKLSFSDYLSLLGIKPCQTRPELFEKIAPYLKETSQMIWKKHKKKIDRGVLFEGAVEKRLLLSSRILNKLLGRKIEKLFSFDDIGLQKAFLEKEWHSVFLRKGFEFFLHPMMTRFFIRDPGLYNYIDPQISVGKYLYNRFHSPLEHMLAKNSLLFSLIFRGKVGEEVFPPYLSEAKTLFIKKKCHSSKFYTCNLLAFLEKAENEAFDCFSLSDVASYLSKKDFAKLLHHVYRTARPGARFCIRQFLSNYKIPSHLEKGFERDLLLERKLEREDRCFVYQFMTGRVLKN